MVMVKTEQQQNKKKSSSVPIMTSSSSSSNKNKMKKFKGVRMRSWGSWVSEIRAPNQKTRIWLGSYSTAAAAARAYDAALLCLRGASSAANLNFPASSYQNTVPTPNDLNMSPKTIQRVAASAANTISSPSPSPSLSSPSPSPSPSPLEEASSNSSNYYPQYSSQESFFEDFDWCGGFDELRYVDHDRAFCDDYLLPFDQTAMVDYSYEESGDIRLWSFC